MMLSLSWKLNETWLSRQPLLSVIYLYEHFSYYICLLVRTFNGKWILESQMTNRDSS